MISTMFIYTIYALFDFVGFSLFFKLISIYCAYKRVIYGSSIRVGSFDRSFARVLSLFSVIFRFLLLMDDL